jgi:hypothetical protein
LNAENQTGKDHFRVDYRFRTKDMDVGGVRMHYVADASDRCSVSSASAELHDVAMQLISTLGNLAEVG